MSEIRIEFKKVKRDCKYNRDLDAEGARRGFLYDYHVEIEGEHRATWVDVQRRRRYGYRWEMRDIDGYAIWFDEHNRAWAKTKDEFASMTRDALSSGVIPTAEQIDAKRAARRQAENEAAAAALAKRRLDAKRRAAPAMYDALVALRTEIKKAFPNHAARAGHVQHDWVTRIKLILDDVERLEASDENAN